jgi:hypothetical protein
VGLQLVEKFRPPLLLRQHEPLGVEHLRLPVEDRIADAANALRGDSDVVRWSD